MPRERGQKVVATNRKARHDYSIEDVFEAGIVLTGTEVKSLRAGRASLVDGYAVVDGGEIWLENVHIPEYTEGTWNNHSTRRKRKLLMHREEIAKSAAQFREQVDDSFISRLRSSDGWLGDVRHAARKPVSTEVIAAQIAAISTACITL